MLVETIPGECCSALTDGQPLFALVDGAQDLDLAITARASFNLETTSLFDDHLADSLAHLAPYLIKVGLHDPFLEVWDAHLGRHSGFLFTSPASFDDVYVHLVNNLHVRDEYGLRCLFRFYDPRVLRDYLPSCETEELEKFFGPIQNIYMENETYDGFTRYNWTDRRLRIREC